MEERDYTNCGRKQNQRLKPYLILQILMRESDANHVLSSKELANKLADWGIEGARHSIYQDIKAINEASWLLRHRDKSIYDAEEAIKKDKYSKEKIVLYDESKKGFYLQPKDYSAQEIQLLVESVYTARFLTQKDCDRMTAFLCGFVSKDQAEDMRHDALMTDRVRTNNKAVLSNIGTIKMAMEDNPEEGQTPQKIRFKYLRYNFNGEQVERKKGAVFTVSPYKLLINEGNYYLLAYVSENQKMQTFRVDRMGSVSMIDEPRDGKEAFAAINLKDYTKRTIEMFDGTLRRVTIQFANSQFDTVYERFGKDGAVYTNKDAHHFILTTEVKITPRFFSWLVGFGTSAILLGDKETVDKFRKYIDEIRKHY